MGIGGTLRVPNWPLPKIELLGGTDGIPVGGEEYPGVPVNC